MVNQTKTRPKDRHSHMLQSQCGKQWMKTTARPKWMQLPAVNLWSLLLRSQRSGRRALSAKSVSKVNLVHQHGDDHTLTLKMCCTETGDAGSQNAAITSSFHKLTAAQSPHTQKLSDGHVSPWNVFFYCTCHGSVDVDKDTWIAHLVQKQTDVGACK